MMLRSLLLTLLFCLSGAAGMAAPVIAPIGNVTIPAGKSLILPVTAVSPNAQPLTYTVLSSTNGIAVVMHTNNPFWELTVAQRASASAPGAYQTPFRGGLATVTNVGTMTFMLFPEYAPHTVNVFQGLTTSGFYNSNTIFHRVISKFVIQGGDPDTNGTGGPVFRYDDEFNPQAMYSGNGQLAVANSGKDTDGSQFFITAGPQRNLDFAYTLFGQLVRGFPVLTNINNTAVDTNSRPLADEIIQTAAYVTNTSDTVITLTATNSPGATGTITVIADDGVGGRATNTFTATVAKDAASNNQAFIYPGVLTNMVGPVNMTLTNFLTAVELDGDLLYWYPIFQDQTSYNAASGSSLNESNNLFRMLTYNVTNAQGQVELFIKPTNNYVGPVSVEFDVSYEYNANWDLYKEYGLSLPAYDQQTYTFIFGDTPISGQSNVISVPSAAQFNDVLLATFTNGVAGSDATNFTAEVNWGDNSTNSVEVVNGSNGEKEVLGSHTYSYPGTYPVYVTVTSAIGASTTVLSWINAIGPVEPPVLSIAYPASGQVLTNQYSAPATIAGNTFDNDAIAGVWFQANSGGWQQASGTNIWTASFTPVYGSTNVIQVYSVNALNEPSPTNTLLVKYLAGDIPDVTVSGLGSVSPNLNNSLLPFGSNYTLTATAASGFNFAGWSGSFATNKSVLSFTMTSNVSLTATFLNQTKPALTITNLVTGQRVSNSVITVGGTASDSWTVAAVEYQVNGGGWIPATGTAKWSAVLNLQAGTNLFQAYAVDGNGTRSTTNTMAVDYVVPAQLQLSATGLGTITPNDSNSVLEVGRNYTLTATPAAGFGFAGWSGSFATNKTALTFMMEPGLSFTANFADVTAPTISVTNLITGQRVSNSIFTVFGKASDNWSLAGVQYQLNYGGWTPTSGSSTWSATLHLNPGTNIFQAYASDTTGNHSITNTLIVYYVVSAQLQLQTAGGLGTISPNYSNAVLEVGKSYTLTAASAAGFAFTNWSGSLATNKAALTFTMESNYSFTANFRDITPPVLTVTNLVTAQRTTNSTFTVGGRASDNWSLAGVQFQLNSNGWSSAAGLTNWSTALYLQPGTNYFQAFAIDTAGNRSPTNTLMLYYARMTPLTLAITGRGTITPNDSNAWLEVGKPVTLTATAATGFTFTNWNGSLATNKPVLTFLMASNLSLTANFADTTPPVVAITNLASGQRITNSTFTVRGTASDNWHLDSVQYQLNSNGWYYANGTTNWAATLNLQAGTNLFQVASEDTSSNFSAIASRTIDCVVTSLLQMTIDGSGTVSPNYTAVSNAWLEVGRNYTVTAQPATGWILYNWLDANYNTITTNRALTFNMAPNLALTANFHQLPVITTQPSNILAFVGSSATFNVAATGTGPLAYQWQFNSASLSGQNSSSLTLSPLATNNAGSYRVIVNSFSQSVTSSVAKLTLTNPPPSLNGLATIVTPAGGIPFQLSFASNTFSLFSTNLDTTSSVGFYEFVYADTELPGLSPLTGQLSIGSVAPPTAASTNITEIDLTFVSPGWAVYTNADDSSSGTIQYYTATNFAPAAWSGHKLSYAAGEVTNTISFTSTNAFSMQAAAGTASPSGTYLSAPFSRVAVLLELIGTDAGTNYLQLQFTNTTGGYYISNKSTIGGEPFSIQQGAFKWQ